MTMANTISILDGNHFVVSDRQGDLEATPTVVHGLFLNDTRYLSRWVLTINGQQPKLLSVDDTAYYRVQHFMALATGAVYIDSHLSVIRQRAIGDGFHETLVLRNHGAEPVDLDVHIEAAADFADLFEVKNMLQKKGTPYRKIEDKTLVLGYSRDQFHRETRVTSSVDAQMDEKGLSYRVRLAPRSDWSTNFDIEVVKKVETH